MNKQRVILMALSLIPGLGPKKILNIINLYPDLEKFWQEKIKPHHNIDINKELNILDKSKINFITYLDNDYPYLLKQIYDPPIILYYKGDINLANQPNILAVVGTRNISPYAKQIMPPLLKPIVEQNIIIVSGLALGVDCLAHQIALEKNQSTIAVLGTGLDDQSIYPKQNFNLANNIVQQKGLLLSEYKPYSLGIAANFPRRNRIISGLSKAVLIVEAATKSGSLITAYQALEQNRELLAIPGNITLTNSQGTNRLLQQGAKLIKESNDILEIFDKHHKHLTKIELTIIEQKVLSAIKSPQTIDKIYEYSKIDIDTLNATLSLMEIKGYIKSQGSYYYSII